MKKMKSDLFYQKNNPLGLFCWTVKTGFASCFMQGRFHHLNEFCLLLQGLEKNILKAYKIKLFSKKYSFGKDRLMQTTV